MASIYIHKVHELHSSGVGCRCGEGRLYKISDPKQEFDPEVDCLRCKVMRLRNVEVAADFAAGSIIKAKMESLGIRSEPSDKVFRYAPVQSGV